MSRIKIIIENYFSNSPLFFESVFIAQKKLCFSKLFMHASSVVSISSSKMARIRQKLQYFKYRKLYPRQHRYVTFQLIQKIFEKDPYRDIFPINKMTNEIAETELATVSASIYIVTVC